MLIPVPSPLGGVIIVGEQTLVYHSGTVRPWMPTRMPGLAKPHCAPWPPQYFKAIPTKQTVTCAYGRVDADGSRYLLGDSGGAIMLLLLARDGPKCASSMLPHCMASVHAC